VIAVKHEEPDGSFYVLRATIDMQLLNKQIQALDLGPSSDVFIINRKGILQTETRSHGDILSYSTVAVPSYSTQAEVIGDYLEGGQSRILGYAYIENSPLSDEKLDVPEE